MTQEDQSMQKRETISPQCKQQILKSINHGFVNTAEDIAELYPEVSEEQAIELLNDDEFYLQIANNTRARMRMLYHTKGVDVLEELLDSKDSKDKVAGYDRLAKATGGIQEDKGGVNNFNFFNIEDLLEAKEKRERVINPEFNRVKNKKDTSQPSRRETEVNGNIFENEEEMEEDLEDTLEELFDESEELDFDE